MKRLALFLACAFSLVVLFHPAVGEIVKKKGPVQDSPCLDYEGVLTDPSGGSLSGEYVVVFRLYDSPSSQVAVWEEIHRVAVDSGEFRVLLGRHTPLPQSASGTCYLGVFVNGEELLPRHLLTQVMNEGERDLLAQRETNLIVPPPHRTGVFDDRFVNETGDTMSGNLIVDANVGIGTMTPGAPLDVEGSSVGSILRVTNTDGGAGLVSESTGDSPLWTFGLYGEGENTSSGAAVGGWCKAMSAGTGVHYGLYSEGEGSSSGAVYGTYGSASNTSNGEAYGGFFTTSSSGSGSHTGVKSEAYANAPNIVYGVDAWASNTGSGEAVAGRFQTDIEGGGLHFGVRSQAASEEAGSSAYAVDGFAASYGSGNAYGGYFSTYSDGTGIHYGVYASGVGISGDAYGTYCRGENSGSAGAYGGYFQTTGYGTGTHYGIYGDADCSASSTNSLFGGYFTTSSSGSGSHYGLYATGYGGSTGNVRGIYAYANNSGSGEAVAGRFQVTSSGTGTHYGVYGIEAAGGTGAAVYASGDLIASGDKNAIVKTTQGHRLLSVIESPEVWFEDFGEARLVNGRAHVELDPLFLETVTIGAEHPMKVFVQLNDENCNGTAIKRQTTGFDVVELHGGTSNASFSYRVVAKRRGYEDERLRETDVGYDDPHLYPELHAEMERAQGEASRESKLPEVTR